VLLTLLTAQAMAVTPAVERLYAAGKASLEASEPAVALAHFKDALRQAEGDDRWTWRLLLAVALTYKVKEEPQHAIEYFRRFLARTEAHRSSMRIKWQKRRQITERELVTLETEVEGTHGFVPVESTPTGAEISVDGSRAGADGDATTPFMLILKPGAHLVRITMDGHVTAEEKVTVRVGDSQPMRLILTAVTPTETDAEAPAPAGTKTDAEAPAPAGTETDAEAPAPAGTETDTEAPAPVGTETADASVVASAEVPADAGSPVLAYITMGAAGAAGLAAVAMTVMASEEAKAMDELNGRFDANPNAPEATAWANEYTEHEGTLADYELIGGILYGVAIAGVTTGVILLLLDDTDDAAADDTPMPAFDLTPTQGGLYGRATWRF
jgi:hypothetical protein